MNAFYRDGERVIIIMTMLEYFLSDYAFAKIFKNGKNKVVYSNLLLRMVSIVDLV